MILLGDCRELLPTLDAGSVRCCVTSPPYWGLRDYGTAKWEGGDAGCDHVHLAVGMSDKNTLGPAGFLPETNAANVGRVLRFRETCGKCGARRIDSQIGLEKTPEEYVAAIVGVFREVRRVLADDGTLWLNLGDSYARAPGRGVKFSSGTKTYLINRQAQEGNRGPDVPEGLKEKDLVGIPWRVAFALQADGWYLRSDIIWHKPNPMPESVTDRPTKAHEYVFLLSKRARYFYNGESAREPGTRYEWASQKFKGGDLTRHHGSTVRAEIGDPTAGRNARTVWTIPTQPTPDAHFATFPEALAARCILAGSAEGDTVLDPFFGSGTVGKVAERLGRKWIGCELNPAYVEIGKKKTAQMGLLN